MRVLVACEYSGRVRDAFQKRGHFAMSCDLLPSDSDGFHYKGNALELLDMQWDLLIAHPPCTYLTNSGVRWLKEDPTRWELLDEGAAFFKKMLDAPISRKCIENPIQHKYAKERIGRSYDQVIQPWMFGHMEQKATCLWLENLPPLKPTCNVKDEMLKLPKRERESGCITYRRLRTAGRSAARPTQGLRKQWQISGGNYADS